MEKKTMSVAKLKKHRSKKSESMGVVTELEAVKMAISGIRNA